jgi:hypothetical protein
VNTAPKESPLPPPGPFVTPLVGCTFTEIQPRFLIHGANAHQNGKVKEEEQNGTEANKEDEGSRLL